MSAKVSIIIPVYNTAELLPRCLQSVTEQTLTDTEIICVNDGSTDHSAQVLDEWAKRDSRITVIHQQNGRQGKARNAAMAIARGEYIGMIDSDDYIPANYFETLYNAAKTANADIAICGIIKEKPSGNRTVIEFRESKVITTTDDKLKICKCPPEFHPVNKLYRREMLERTGLRFAEGVQYEDVMFVFRAICESGRLVTVPDLFYRYVLNSSSTVKSKQTRSKQLQKYQAHKSMVDYASANGLTIPNKERNITVSHNTVCGICLWKIKEKNNRRTLRLFDAIPLYFWKAPAKSRITTPVDIVYMWVDGNDPAWQAKRDRYLGSATKNQGTIEARWIENDELKYSLRSIEKFAPWINRIFIVTDGQCPEWLDTTHPKVVLVNHNQILPANALPTFNSTAIENSICNIDELSEYFFLGNDDMFFTGNIGAEDLFSEDGRPVVRLNSHRFNKRKAKRKGNYAIKIDRMQNLIAEEYGKKIQYAPHHCFDLYSKSIIRECIASCHTQEWSKTSYSRFRNDSDMHRSYIGYYMIATGRAIMKKASSYSRCIPVNTKDYNYVLKKYKPLMVCMNDGEGTTNSDRRRMVEFMKSLFPQKSSFEK